VRDVLIKREIEYPERLVFTMLSVLSVVSCADVYRVLYSEDKVYHTANLKQSKDGNCIGKVVDKAIIGQKGS
jgi:ribosomal protein S4E